MTNNSSHSEFLNKTIWATYEEFQAVEKTSSIKQTDIESLLNFGDSKLTEEIGEICPVLSAALKGAMG